MKTNILLVMVMVGFILGCKPNEDTPPQEPLVLLSKIKTSSYELGFEYNEKGVLTRLVKSSYSSLEPLGHEDEVYNFSYLPDGRLSLITGKIPGSSGNNASYTFTWSSQTVAQIACVSLYDAKSNVTLTTNSAGQPIELKTIDDSGILLSGLYTYKYNAAGNCSQIDPGEPVNVVIGYVSDISTFDDKKSPFARNFTALMLINNFENINYNYVYNLPFGSINNPLDQKSQLYEACSFVRVKSEFYSQ